MRRLDRFLPDQRQSLALVRDVARRLFRNMLPLIGLPLIAQANVLVERIVSSKIGTEVIPSVDYARTIADTTVQLIAVPLGILTMSRHGGSTSDEAKQHVPGHSRRGHAALLSGLRLHRSARRKHRHSAVCPRCFRRPLGRGYVVNSVAGWAGVLGATVTAYYLVKALNAQLRNAEALAFTVLAAGANMLVNVLCGQLSAP